MDKKLIEVNERVFDEKTIEVIESYKKSLRDTLEGHGDIVEDLVNEGAGKNGLFVNKHGIPLFFEFEAYGGKTVNPDGSYEPIISMTVSTIIYIPKLTLKERVTFMEKLAERINVMMLYFEDDNYALKVHSNFIDDLDMTVNAIQGASAVIASHRFITDCLEDKKK
jgi:hypothetical protein